MIRNKISKYKLSSSLILWNENKTTLIILVKKFFIFHFFLCLTPKNRQERCELKV